MSDDFTKYLMAAGNDIGKEKSPNKPDILTLIQKLEATIAELQTTINKRDVQLKHVKSYYKSVDVTISQINGITKALENIYNKKKVLAERSQPESSLLFARSKSKNAPGKESPCMRNVRETCEIISSFFMQQYYENAGLQVEKDKEISKDELWNQTEDIVHSYSPQEIQDAMVSNVKQSTSNLNEICSRIDLKRDAQNLKFMFETGKLKDVSTKPVLMQTVQQLIEEGQKQHFKRFLASEKAKNKAHELEKKLQSINNGIKEKISNKYEGEKAEELMSMMLLKQEEGMLDSSHQYLQQEITRLKAEKHLKEKEVGVLLEKYDRIQSFDRTVQGKQTVIQRLIKNNGSAKSKHQQQHNDIVTKAEEKIIKCQSELPAVCDRFKEAQLEEISEYTKTPIANLQTIITSSDKRLLVSELSINRTSQKFKQPGGEQLKMIQSTIEASTHTPSESIISKLLETTGETFDRRSHLANDEQHRITNTVTKMEEIRERISHSNKEDINASLPSLKDCQRKSHDILSESLKFRNAVNTWWDQPAQHLVPWVKEDGHNTTQYLDKFTANSELLKKIQLIN
ncbi:putative leucine-rich repeat-containing protein DDB_G0290503 [Clytia hemisphaerica]|uniref:Uncharacterized protein n=1 Tax=Clytia hemisphaerica TaxID=252671 RepID=A0A7M5WJK8_9CNID